MRKIIFSLILFLILSVPDSWAAISLIADTCAGGTYNSVTTGAINTTGASLIVVAVAYASSGHVSTPTDSQSNTWIGLTPQTYSDTETVLYYAVNPTTSPSHQFSEPDSDAPGICVMAFSGTSISSPFYSQNGAGNAGTTLAAGNVTPNSRNGIAVTAVGTGYLASTMSINSSFIIPVGASLLSSYSVYYGLTMAYYIQGAISTVDPVWTEAGSGNLAAAIATFDAIPSLYTAGSIQGNSSINGNSAIF